MKVYLIEEGVYYQEAIVIALFLSESEAFKFATEYAGNMKRCGIHLWSENEDYIRIMTHETFSSAEEALEEINN